jgi:hypothetical protein
VYDERKSRRVRPGVAIVAEPASSSPCVSKGPPWGIHVGRRPGFAGSGGDTHEGHSSGRSPNRPGVFVAIRLQSPLSPWLFAGRSVVGPGSVVGRGPVVGRGRAAVPRRFRPLLDRALHREPPDGRRCLHAGPTRISCRRRAHQGEKTARWPDPGERLNPAICRRKGELPPIEAGNGR